ncbi:MAG: helix-turn-helix transcriptional regulator [Varibaculum cambriense]|nr:helix-turn-helix transcriptional regulator [Varibaculum cambriense]
MELSIQERLKELRVERGLTLEQLAEQTHLSKSALGSYEGDNFKDISHYALIELAKFYEVTVDYLLGRSQIKNHPFGRLDSAFRCGGETGSRIHHPCPDYAKIPHLALIVQQFVFTAAEM